MYCAEGVDNGGDVLSLSLDREGALREEAYDPDLLGGIVPITAQGWRVQPASELYTWDRPQRKQVEVKLVPYYTWANRGENQMRVWLPEN